MSQAGFTPIQLYLTTTAATVPLAANLAAGELALNNNDGKLFYKDSSGVVQVIATKATAAGVTSFTAGTTGLTPSTATSGAVTLAGTLAIANGGTGLTALGTGVQTALGQAVTGSGAIVLATSPTLVTPALGTPASGVVTNLTGTASININGTVGATTASTGAFTTLSATSTVSGAGFTAYFASPPAIGSTAAGTGAFTTLSASSTVSGAGFTNYFASPPAIGSTAASTGAFTTLSSVGTTSATAFKVANITETANIVASAPSATTNFYVNAGAVQFYTTSAANNWTLNVAFSSGTSLNTAMAIGDSISVTMLSTQGATAYYNSAVTIDGTSVTPKWQGGTAPTTGNVSGIDIYTYAIIKTASATYTVLASQTQFK